VSASKVSSDRSRAGARGAARDRRDQCRCRRASSPSSTPTSCRMRCRPSYASSGPRVGEVALERYPVAAAGCARLSLASSAWRAISWWFGNGSDELISILCSASRRRGERARRRSSIRFELRLLQVRRGRARGRSDRGAADRDLRARRAAMIRAIGSTGRGRVPRAADNRPDPVAARVCRRARRAVPRRSRSSRRAYLAYSGATSLPVLAAPQPRVMRTLSSSAGRPAGRLHDLVAGGGAHLGSCGHRTMSARSISAPPSSCSSTRPRGCAARAAEVVRRAYAAIRRAVRPWPRGVSQRGEPRADPHHRRVRAVAAAGRRRHSVRLFDVGRLAGCLRITVGTRPRPRRCSRAVTASPRCEPASGSDGSNQLRPADRWPFAWLLGSPRSPVLPYARRLRRPVTPEAWRNCWVHGSSCLGSRLAHSPSSRAASRTAMPNSLYSKTSKCSQTAHGVR